MDPRAALLLALAATGSLLAGCTSQTPPSTTLDDTADRLLSPPPPAAPPPAPPTPPAPAPPSPTAPPAPPFATPRVRDEVPCDRGVAPTYSGNAPLLLAYLGPPTDVAARVAAAVGDPLVSMEAEEIGARQDAPAATRWNTTHGAITVTRDGTLRFTYGAARIWPGLEPGAATAEFREFLVRLSLTEAERANVTLGATVTDPGRNSLRLNASEGAAPIVVPQALSVETYAHYGNRTTAIVGPLHDLSAARASLAEAEAIRMASEFMLCTLGEGTRAGSNARLAVVNASLVYHVEPEGIAAVTRPGGGTLHGCPPPWLAYVDAVTGTVHAWQRRICI